jgi:hypothetical protein
MTLFHWPHCEVLRDYASGDIFVEAQDVTQARAIAERDFWEYLKRRPIYEFYFEYQNAEDKERIDAEVAMLRADIAKEPRVITNGAVFIEGSE